MDKKDVQYIYHQWIGGFINSEKAMSLIGKELDKVNVRNVKVFADGEQIGTFDDATINYKTLT